MTCRFLPGKSLWLVIGGTDITKCTLSLSQKYDEQVKKGRHTVYSRGKWDAYLLFPVVEGLDLGVTRGNR